ncbi:MAG: hypothetical protein E7287_09195 [Lachnospiraceae bacterium]|nr:hypothetical protein [Lachnospiraceae bacterium]
MNFSESYKRTFDNIKRDGGLDKKVLDALEPTQKVSGFRGWKAAVAAMAMVCAVMVVTNFGSIAGYAEVIVGRFGLWVGGEELKLSEMTPVEMDVERFIADERTTKVDLSNYSCYFNNQEELTEVTGLVVTESPALKFQKGGVIINTEYGTGHMTLEIMFESKIYNMNGMFVLEGNNQTEYGYGEESKPYYAYKYAEGKKAYFVKDREYDDLQKVYFTVNGIMYQLFVDKSAEGKKIGMKIVDAFVK